MGVSDLGFPWREQLSQPPRRWFCTFCYNQGLGGAGATQTLPERQASGNRGAERCFDKCFEVPDYTASLKRALPLLLRGAKRHANTKF